MFLGAKVVFYFDIAKFLSKKVIVVKSIIIKREEVERKTGRRRGGYLMFCGKYIRERNICGILIEKIF